MKKPNSIKELYRWTLRSDRNLSWMFRSLILLICLIIIWIVYKFNKFLQNPKIAEILSHPKQYYRSYKSIYSFIFQLPNISFILCLIIYVFFVFFYLSSKHMDIHVYRITSNDSNIQQMFESNKLKIYELIIKQAIQAVAIYSITLGFDNYTKLHILFGFIAMLVVPYIILILFITQLVISYNQSLNVMDLYKKGLKTVKNYRIHNV